MNEDYGFWDWLVIQERYDKNENLISYRVLGAYTTQQEAGRECEWLNKNYGWPRRFIVERCPLAPDRCYPF